MMYSRIFRVFRQSVTIQGVVRDMEPIRDRSRG
jgi:hypothetical protein